MEHNCGTTRHPTLEQDINPLMISVFESWKGKKDDKLS